MQTRELDVLGLGAVAVDDLLYVDAYPGPDTKCQVLRMERHCGGLAATALVAAARLGARCAYAGVLGTDHSSAFAAAVLESEGVDLSHASRLPTARIYHSHIVVGVRTGTRNIFAFGDGVVGAAPEAPPEAVIRSSRVLLVDHVGLPGMIRAAGIARRHGIPVVADLERRSGRGFAGLFNRVDHLLVSSDFAAEITGIAEPGGAALKLWNRHRSVVTVTDGARGCWYVDRPGLPGAIRVPAFRVKVVDTTGCGDVFHGAYAASLAAGCSVIDCLRRASAAAALKATRPGGQAGCPDAATLQRFLRHQLLRTSRPAVGKP